MRAACLLVLAGAFGVACEAIDDFSAFHVVARDDGGGANDAALDLVPTSDLGAVDLATRDLATGDLAAPDLASPDLATRDLATPDLAPSDFATPDLAPPDLAATPDLAAPDLAAAADLAPTCTMTLANIGAGDFRISFDVTTTATTDQPLLNQRAACDTSQAFWAVGTHPNGVVVVETNSAAAYTSLLSTLAVNDGHLHHVVAQRVAGTLALSIDGAAQGTAASPAVFGALPQLQIAMETACNVSSSAATIGSVCVTP